MFITWYIPLNCNNILFFQIRFHVRQQQNPKFSSPKAKGAVLDPDLNRKVPIWTTFINTGIAPHRIRECRLLLLLCSRAKGKVFSSFLPAFHLIPTSLLREVVESEQKKECWLWKNMFMQLESVVTKKNIYSHLHTYYFLKKFSMHIKTSQESIFFGSEP